jgi:predicted O-linked N-acetylglucosamine transferase (SPINDLY family)
MSKLHTLKPGIASRHESPEDAHRRRGNVLLEQGQLDQAAQCYAEALNINPNSAQTINSLGVLLYRARRLEQSVVCYQKAISLQPAYAEAANNLAIALNQLGRLEEAQAAINQSLQHKPDFAQAHHTLGEILLAVGDLNNAAASVRKALELQPGLVEAYLTLGNILLKQGLLCEAVRTYEHAIGLQPANANLYNNLAEALKEKGELEAAAHAFHQALAIEPGAASIFSNLLCLYAFTRYGSPVAEKALAMEWEKSIASPQQRSVARERAPANSGTFPASPRNGRKLRLGFVSADLGSHAVAYFLEPLLETLDRNRFHLTLFPTHIRAGPQAERFRELAESYISLVELSDSQAADRIRSERVDVLVDLTGHTCGGRLGVFVHRAAPVQCAYLGYTGTTGLTEMDWVFSEPSLADHFSERVWSLPRLGVCYRGEKSLPESNWVPDPDGTIWLGSLCRYNKIRQETLSLWAKVLHALPPAKLLFEDSACCQQETHQRILTTLSNLGIEQHRVSFIPYLPGHERHMMLYNRLDIALDTVPLNGGTTGFDALWMGVPLVVLEGNWTGGRLGYHLVNAFGRPDWVAHNEEEYVSIVSALARDLEGRVRQRTCQRAQMELGPACDAMAMTRCLESAFEAMYEGWRTGAVV